LQRELQEDEMRLNAFATGSMLVTCAMVALISCNPDEQQTDAGLAPTTPADGFSAAAAPIGPALHVGLSNTADPEDLGKGPGNDEVGPRYGIAQGIPPTNWTTLNAYIDKADALDIILVLNLAGGRTSWTDPMTCDGVPDGMRYDSTEYDNNTRRFEGHAKLADAIARHRAVIYLVDEPFHKAYCNTLPPRKVNNMGRLVKSIWPKAITIVRGSAGQMRGGWDNSGPLGPSFWSKVDYGWAQYNRNAAVDSTPSEYYTAEKAGLDSINLGMIPGINIWSGGKTGCWDYKDTGSSSGRIHGSESNTPGRMDACGTTTTNVFWVASPGFLRTVFDAARTDPDAPFFSGWNHVDESAPASTQVMDTLETRKDFVFAFEHWINTGANRTSWGGWRTPKP